MNIDELMEWVEKHSIEEKTAAAFKGFLLNYEINNPKEYSEVFGNIDKNVLKYQIHTISMHLGNWPKCNYNTISASMWVFYNDKQICSYKVLYTFDGVAEDDFFDIP